ncbi:hypothetical protein GR702_18530 [Novosphingobium sp. FGD1]|jgi:uncharacterized membrane protein|uniref:Uncharacterized protein n=1 Tax=Novosphingobium silvae TaxID=2692619 RepID=A0A7X4K9V0_9SPHN|nr:hypothetical protein [Novosphingobium silvae]MYL99758.1 hypothetical protein [Novosphingobium silvae]
MDRSTLLRLTLPLTVLAVAACHSASEQVPGDAANRRPFDGIAADETVHFLGTEPFWGGHVQADSLTYTTPENATGETVTASRFAGRGGMSFSGRLAAGDFTLAVSPGACTDGMSDARYPFIATMQIGSETRKGCAWTERQPRTAR